MDVLGTADDSMVKKKDTSVIIHARNAKCLGVLERELKHDLQPQKIAILYGAAHLPDFHQQLSEKAWRKTGEKWLTAWEIPISKGK